MKKFALVLSFLSLAAAISARADSIVFNNVTAISYTEDGYLVGQDSGTSWSVDNSFTLYSAATIDQVTAGVWVPTGSTLSSVDAGFYGAPFAQGTVYASGGITPVSATLKATNVNGWDIYEEYFVLSPIALGPGTYYLDFLSAITFNGSTYASTAAWDISGNPNTSADQWNTEPSETSGLESTTFTLYGSGGNSAVPEPSSLLLLGSGAAALFGALRRRVKA